MVIYAVIMFVIAVVFGVVAVLIYKGKTNLIHDYHQIKVVDKTAYGKAFGRIIGMLAGGMTLSGIVALLGNSAVWGAITILVAGLIVGIIALIQVQKKYNGGVF